MYICIYDIYFCVYVCFGFFIEWHINLRGLFNAIFVEQQCCYIKYSRQDKEVDTFHKGINPDVNGVALLEFELASFEAAVQYFGYYTTGSPVSVFADYIYIYIYIYI